VIVKVAPSARLMLVSASPLLARRAPKPVSSPGSRQPQGTEIVVSLQQTNKQQAPFFRTHLRWQRRNQATPAFACDSPIQPPQRYPLFQSALFCARRATCDLHEASSRRPIAMAPASANPAATLSAQRGSTPAPMRVVTTAARAGSDDALNAPADKAFRSLAQVTTPSDGLPDPSSCWTAQCGPSTCPLPAG